MTNRPALLSLLLLTTIACDAELEGEQDGLRDETEVILDNLAHAGFSDDFIEIDDHGHVILGGDIHINLDASYELAAQVMDDDEGFRHYRTSNLVTDDLICVDASAYGNNDKLDAIDGAIRRFNAQALSFEMRRVSSAEPDCDTVITVNRTNGTSGSAGFPSGGHAYDTINMGDGIWSNYGKATFRQVFMHELGHTVGFRHTDYYNRSISCSSGGNEGGAGIGAHHIPNTPTTASNNGSVMNACYNENADGEWTNTDVTALTTLYGVGFCSAFNGRQISLKTNDDRFVRASDSSKNWRLDARDGKNANTTFTVECHNNKPWLRTSHGRYVSAQGSNDDYILRQRSGWNSVDWFAPAHYDNGKWELKTRFNRWIRAKDGGDNWKIKQVWDSQSDTRFKVHLEN